MLNLSPPILPRQFLSQLGMDYEIPAEFNPALHAASCPLLAKYTRNGAPCFLVAPGRSKAGANLPQKCEKKWRKRESARGSGARGSGVFIYSDYCFFMFIGLLFSWQRPECRRDFRLE
jgi:hypothetical protein